MTVQDRMRIGKIAIEHVLIRIGNDPAVRNLLGVGTQSFELLTEAYAAITKQEVDKVRDGVIPGSAAIHRPRTREEAA